MESKSIIYGAIFFLILVSLFFYKKKHCLFKMLILNLILGLGELICFKALFLSPQLNLPINSFTLLISVGLSPFGAFFLALGKLLFLA